MSRVLTLSDANFAQEVVGSDLPWLVDFWAQWCAPCFALEPVLGEVAADLAGRLRVGRVDILANPGVVDRYAVTSVPTLLVFSGGVVARRLFGTPRKRVLLAELQDALTGRTEAAG